MGEHGDIEKMMVARQVTLLHLHSFEEKAQIFLQKMTLSKQQSGISSIE